VDLVAAFIGSRDSFQADFVAGETASSKPEI
jgi:hypothetical protein